MTASTSRRALLLAVLLLPGAAAAEDVLDHLPQDALGFAVIRNLAGSNAKIERATKIFAKLSSSPIPAPLPFIKAATGLGAGLDDAGDAMLVVLPGDSGATPRPLLVVPVSDYGKFAASVSGDAEGEICRVTIAGEEVLVAKSGSFAVLMNVEHRSVLESLVAGRSKPAAVVAPISAWLKGNDAAVVLLPAGVKALLDLGRADVAQQRAQMQEQLSDAQLADRMKELQESVEFSDAVLQFCGAEINAAALGLSLDDASNLRISKRLVLEKDGQLVKIAGSQPTDASKFTGYAAGPFVGAVGGPVPESWVDVISKASRGIIEQFKELYGFKDFEEEDWKRVEDSSRAAMDGLRSISMIMLAGDKDDPVYSNVFGILTTTDAKQYLASIRKSMELWNDLMSRSSDMKLKYEFENVQIEGKGAVLMTSDISAIAADPNVPMMKPMMDALFGKDGKIRMYFVAADGKTVVMGICPPERLTKVMQRAASGETGLAQSASVQKTVKLMDEASPWRAVVSPKGCVAWFSRLFSAMMAQFGGAGAPVIPEYPDSPPVGVAVNLADGVFSGDIVVPVETLEGLATYIKKCEDAP